MGAREKKGSSNTGTNSRKKNETRESDEQLTNSDNDYSTGDYYDDDSDRHSSLRNHTYNSDHEDHELSGPFSPDYDENEFEEDDFDNEYRTVEEREGGRKRGGFDASGQNQRYGSDTEKGDSEKDRKGNWPSDSYFSMPGQNRGQSPRQEKKSKNIRDKKS